MEVTFTEVVQLGLDHGSSFLFETTKVEMTATLERLVPDLRGGLILGAPVEGSWLVVCTIRPPLTALTAAPFVFRCIESSWILGAVRVIQEAIACLAYLRDYCFLGTRFESFGRHDEDGHPLPFSPDPEGFSPNLTHMEIMLHHT